MMLFNVPGATSSLGLPGTVTRPGFTGCLYCRWLPRVATRNQPLACSIRRISLIFILEEYQLAHLQTIRADSERHQVQAQGRSAKNDRAAPPAGRLDQAVTPWADGARQQRTAVRIPHRYSSGGGWQPGTATSTGMTLASRPQVA